MVADGLQFYISQFAFGEGCLASNVLNVHGDGSLCVFPELDDITVDKARFVIDVG